MTDEHAPVAGQEPAVPEQKKRGKPKDPHAPPKPKAPFQAFQAPIREKLKAERPELLTDLSGMGKAIAEEWAKVPEEEKKVMQDRYDKEMAIWKPKWLEYKETPHYKQFFEVKQDWVDVRALKKLQKKMTKDAPKRPRSAYMLFAAEVREDCNKEAQAKGLGMGDAAKMIADRWAAVPEAEKAAYAETAARAKAEFEVEFATYRKSDSFKEYMDAKSKMEASQGLKKNMRTSHDTAPKKPPSSYALFKAEVMPGILAENEERAKKGTEKLGLKEIAGKIAELWAKADEAKKTALSKEAEKLKAEFLEKMAAFKKSEKYLKFLEKRNAIKTKENRMLNLRDLPKRPKSVFGLFADDHKKEVEPGKGEGKGTQALKQKFSEASAEEKAKYTELERQLKEQWLKDVAEYKDGQRYKAFLTVKDKVLKEFSEEADKVTTLRFLSEAPVPPPKSAFAVFLGEKRKRESGGYDMSSAKIKREEVVEARKAFNQLDKTTQKEYDVQRMDLAKKFEEDCKEYMNSDRWKEYVKEAKRLKVPVKSLLFHKKKVKKLLKGEKMKPSMILMPEKPVTFPSKARSAQVIFTKEKKAEVELSKIPDMWKALSEEERAVYLKKQEEEEKECDQEMEMFKKSEEGSKYFRAKAAVFKRRRILAAKNKYLDDMPQKPKSAVIVWFKDQLPIVKKDNPGLKQFELKTKLKTMWSGMEDAKRKEIEAEGAKAMRQYEETMAEFKKSANWQSFVRATRVKKLQKKKKKKSLKKAAAPGPKKPDNYPKKPLGSYATFCKEAANAGKNLKELAKAWADLDPEAKKKLSEDEKERTAKYQEELAEFLSSGAGKAYSRSVEKFKKKQRVALARKKFMKDEPKKPRSAYSLFCEARRPTLSQDFPDVKSMPQQQSKLTELWKNASDDEKAKFVEREKELKEEYEKAVEEFNKSPNYKKFKAIERRALGKPSVKKVKGKGKGKPAIVGPKAPESMPKKPASGFFMFLSEQRKAGKSASPKESTQAWTALGAEGQKEWQDKSREAEALYQKELSKFNSSAEGKKYNREKLVADKKKKTVLIKSKYQAKLPKEPKRPPGSYFIFVGEKNPTIAGDLREKATKAAEMWKNLSPEEKQGYESKAATLKAKYDEELVAYNKHPDVKAMKKALDKVSGKKAKMAAAKKRMQMVKQKAAEAAKAAKEVKKAEKAGKAKADSAAKGKRAAKAAAKGAAKKDAGSDSDSDVMGSDSDNSSSDDTDSD